MFPDLSENTTPPAPKYVCGCVHVRYDIYMYSIYYLIYNNIQHQYHEVSFAKTIKQKNLKTANDILYENDIQHEHQYHGLSGKYSDSFLLSTAASISNICGVLGVALHLAFTSVKTE